MEIKNLVRSVPSLCFSEVPSGTKTGTCCVCGVQTEGGFDLPFSDNFTGFSFLVHGDCVCASCNAFFREPKFRRYCWWANSEGVQFLKRSEVVTFLLEPPEPPFYIYVTKTGQRQGWLQSLRRLNMSRDKFFVATDWVGTVWTTRSENMEMHEIASKLISEKISKTALISGEYTMYQYRQAIEKGFVPVIEKAKKFVKHPMWEVIVYVE